MQRRAFQNASASPFHSSRCEIVPSFCLSFRPRCLTITTDNRKRTKRTKQTKLRAKALRCNRAMCNFNTAGMKIKINGMFFRKTCLSMLNSRSWAAEDQHLKLAANPVATDQYVLCKQQERGAQWMRGWELESHHLRPAQGSFVQGCDNTIEASFFYSFVIGKYFTLLASLHCHPPRVSKNYTSYISYISYMTEQLPVTSLIGRRGSYLLAALRFPDRRPSRPSIPPSGRSRDVLRFPRPDFNLFFLDSRRYTSPAWRPAG